MKTTQQELFRAIPSTESLLTSTESTIRKSYTEEQFPRSLIKELITSYLTELRLHIKTDTITSLEELEPTKILQELATFVNSRGKNKLQRVINASGVIIHTNLGRSILAKEAIKAVHAIASSYSNLEFDLEEGKRGSRYSHVEQILAQLTGAESALVVNNNAAAVFLVLDSFCKNKEVIVSRGELVEIGGSFRVPEIMEKSSCILKEVGATNKTHARDYKNAISEHTAALMKVHSSNFRMIGFVEEVRREELVALAHEKGLFAFEDLGSGSFIQWQKYGLGSLLHEPTVAEVVSSGMDLVTFSGDKVLGGPQAGIIVGKKSLIQILAKNPLHRAFRVDKLTLAALEATLRLYLEPQLAIKSIPTLQMMHISTKDLALKAKRLTSLLRKKIKELDLPYTVQIQEGESLVGGGAFPAQGLTSAIVQIEGAAPETLRELLLKTTPPLIGRSDKGMFCLDPRTIQDNELQECAILMGEALQKIALIER